MAAADIASHPPLSRESRPPAQRLQILHDDYVWVCSPLPRTKSPSAGPLQRKGVSSPGKRPAPLRVAPPGAQPDSTMLAAAQNRPLGPITLPSRPGHSAAPGHSSDPANSSRGLRLFPESHPPHRKESCPLRVSSSSSVCPWRGQDSREPEGGPRARFP